MAFHLRYDLIHQQPQVVVRSAGESLSPLERRWTVPRGHVVVPVQAADGHQCKWRTAGGLRSLKYFLAFVGKGVEVNNGGIYFRTWENGYRLFVYREGVHSCVSSAFYYNEGDSPAEILFLCFLLYIKVGIDATVVDATGSSSEKY